MWPFYYWRWKKICNIFSMLYQFKKGRKAKKKICTVCGEGATTDRKCQKSFVKFYAGDFSLNNAPQSGWPVEVDSNQIDRSSENNQHYTTQKVANILKISRSIKLLLKVKNLSFMEKTKWTFWPTQYIERTLKSPPNTTRNNKWGQHNSNTQN